ncbi:MAG TPA: tripartite tricarboxylate transporter substrate-binding protein [Burkholderiales bacterium]|nr:tripartite tricarboxylate transporter substrate-binding protein [Burkholderiales bacterium]
MRRLCIALVLGFAAAAHAQTYPNKAIRLVVGFPPGGGMDLSARVYAAVLQEPLGTAIVVENRPGATGIVAGEVVAKSAPDGYTLLVGASGQMTINPVIIPKHPYDTVRDFAAITTLAQFPMVIAVNPSFPAKSIAELIALAKAKPGELAYSHGGATHQVAAEMFNQAVGIAMRNIPYKGGAPAVAAAVAGDVPIVVVDSAAASAQIRAGRLRVLAVTSAERTPLVPDAPTVAESGVPGYDIAVWAGLFAPAGTPREIVLRLYREASRAMAAPDTKEKLRNIGMDPGGLAPEQLSAMIKADIARYAAIVKAANIRAD